MKLDSFLIAVMMLAGGHAESMPVTVRGHWSNGPELLWLFYVKDPIIFGSGRLSSAIDAKSGEFEFVVEIDNPSILDLLDTQFVVLPGDTVTIEVADVDGKATLKFVGSRAQEFGLLSTYRKEVGRFRGTLTETRSAISYKSMVDGHFQSSKSLFLKTASMQAIRAQYLDVLMDLLMLWRCDDILRPLFLHNVSKEVLPVDYFDGINLSVFQKTTLLGFRDFIITLNSYNDHYLSKSSLPGRAYDSVSVADNIASAIKNFDGIIKRDLLLFVYANLTQQGSSKNKDQVDLLFQFLISAFPGNPARRSQISLLKTDFEIMDKPLPSEILAQRMMTVAGNTITLAEVFVAGNLKYIDFWASWCGPCVSEMPSQTRLISEFEDKGVQFILISFDKSEENWRRSMKKIEVACSHFLITDGVDSQLAKYLSFNEIPKYVVIDKDGNLVSRNAPRPSEVLRNLKAAARNPFIEP